MNEMDLLHPGADWKWRPNSGDPIRSITERRLAAHLMRREQGRYNEGAGVDGSCESTMRL